MTEENVERYCRYWYATSILGVLLFHELDRWSNDTYVKQVFGGWSDTCRNAERLWASTETLDDGPRHEAWQDLAAHNNYLFQVDLHCSTLKSRKKAAKINITTINNMTWRIFVDNSYPRICQIITNLITWVGNTMLTLSIDSVLSLCLQNNKSPLKFPWSFAMF